MKTVYGPVPSWRLGKSLGIDPVCRKEKMCSFGCAYCQLGKTIHKTIERKEFIEAKQLGKELMEALGKAEAEIVTFSGTSEPTLASNIKELIQTARKNTSLPLAILTNSSMLQLKDVRKVLTGIDVLNAKLDAGNESVFREVNQPHENISFEAVLKGIKNMRKEFKGKRFALQCMFFKANKENAAEIAALAREIKPDEVQLDTPLRPCAVKPLSVKEMEEIEGEFKGMNFVSVYSSRKPTVKVIDLKETLARRPVI